MKNWCKEQQGKTLCAEFFWCIRLDLSNQVESFAQFAGREQDPVDRACRVGHVLDFTFFSGFSGIVFFSFLA